MAFRRPASGWIAPVPDTAREHSTCVPDSTGRHEAQNRCQARSARGPASAVSQVPPPSALTSTRSIPPSAHAQPQISRGLSRASASPGAGDTITDSGATDQTGAVVPQLRPSTSKTGSLYQRVVKAPAYRISASVIRVSHLTLLVP